MLALQPPSERQQEQQRLSPEERSQPTAYCLVYISERLLQQATVRAEDCIGPGLRAQIEQDNRAFADELRIWNEAKAAGRNPDPLIRQVDDFRARFQARLDRCIAEVNGGKAGPEPRLRSLPNYLLALDSQDLLQYVLALEVWREMFPEKSLSSPVRLPSPFGPLWLTLQ